MIEFSAEVQKKLNYLLLHIFYAHIDFDNKACNFKHNADEHNKVLCKKWIEKLSSKEKEKQIEIVNRLFRIAKRIVDVFQFADFRTKRRFEFLLKIRFKVFELSYDRLVFFNNSSKINRFLCVKWVGCIAFSGKAKKIINDLYKEYKQGKPLFTDNLSKEIIEHNYNLFYSDALINSIAEKEIFKPLMEFVYD